MKAKGVIKKISNYVKSFTIEKDYSSDLENHSIECDIILGSCPNLNINDEDEKMIRTIMDHVILKFTYDPNDNKIQKQKNQYINAVSTTGCRIYDTTDDKYGVLYIASSLDNIKKASLLSDIDNHFFKLTTLNLLKYDDNLYEYNEDETSFEFIELKHKSIRHAGRYKGLDIIGYCTCPDVPSKLGLGCMWLSIPYEDITQFSSIAQVYHSIIGHNIVKVNLFDIVKLIDFALYHYSEVDSKLEFTFGDEELIKEKMPIIPSREILGKLMSIMENDYDYFRYALSHIDKEDRYDPDEEDSYIYDTSEDEEEISQEEFYNAAIDQILKGR